MISRTLTRRLLVATALCGLAIGQPVAAQDEMMGESADADSETAERVLLLSALGLAAPDGKTELGDGAGKLESHIILARMLAKFGQTFTVSLKASAGLAENEKVLLWSGEDNFSMMPLMIVDNRHADLERKLPDVDSFCPTPKNGGDAAIFGGDGDAGAAGADDDQKTKLDLSATGLGNTLASLLRSDTSFTRVQIDPSKDLILNAIASSTGLKYLLPGGVAYNAKSEVLEKQLELADKLNELSKEPCAKKDDSPQKKALTLWSEALTALSAPGKDGALSLLEQAVRVEPLKPKGKDDSLKILSVDLETAGGTIQQRSNIWTTLGIRSGVRISGGMVGSYRLTNGVDGSYITSGLVYCNAPISSFGDVHRAPKKGTTQPECTVTAPEQQPK